jgi:hypothetical protein
LTTTIAPSSGAGVLFTQQGVGTSPGYSALDLRRSEIVGPVQEGVYAAGDFMVTQRGAGANMSVDIAAASGAFAAVQGDSVTGQGLYVVGPHSAVINEVIAAADPTNPRVDIVILEVQDNVHDASGGNLARTRVVTGTPTAGATLTNRLGVATVPGSALLLADVLVGAAAGSITNTVIRDRRKWARGAFVRLTKAGTSPTTASTTQTPIDTTNLQARVECSGLPVRVTFNAFASNATAPNGVGTGFQVDGAQVDSTTDLMEMISPVAGQAFSVAYSYVVNPAAGSHLFTATFRSTVGATTATLFATNAFPAIMTVEELVRQNTANNTTTSG